MNWFVLILWNTLLNEFSRKWFSTTIIYNNIKYVIQNITFK